MNGEPQFDSLSPSPDSLPSGEATPGAPRSGMPTAFLAVALFLLAPLPALAQVCLGSPTETGQFSLSGDANITDRTNDFGVGVEYNMPGPLALRAGVSLDEISDDEREARFEGRVSYTVYSNGVSVCPVTGADYMSFSTNGVSQTRIMVPLGLSVGGRVALSEGGPSLIPSIRAGINHRRFSGDDFDQTVTDNSAFVIGGGSISLDEFFIRGEAGVDSADEIDPFYRVSFGVRF
jgi:hypothetical protein